MINNFKILFLLLAIISLGSCQKKYAKDFTFAFYNVENLFDTINNEGVADESYLPDSKVAWNTSRFQHKLSNMSKVMRSIDTAGYPALFGICEVENLGVIEELIAHPNISDAGYNIIHKDSPDERGIDVALLYNPNIFTPVLNQFIKPDLWETTDSSYQEVLTRDILYSKGLINKKDTIHIFVNHWVSRWGGQEKTEPHRIKIAQTIKEITDSIMNKVHGANILIAGDLNDNPTDTSIYFGLKAREPISNPVDNSLYNLSIEQYKNGKGSLYYRSWDMFDQIIVSGSLLTGSNNMKTSSIDQNITKKDWMLYYPKKGPARPSRTSSGGNYYGGYSDHLPVSVKIELTN